MTLARTILTIVLAVSLAALPARVGAMVVAADAHATAATMDMAAMNMAAMDSADAMSDAAAMPMPDDCDQHQGAKRPGACSTYCSSIPALPIFVVASAEAVRAEGIALPVEAAIEGIGPSPEPHPPKLV